MIIKQESFGIIPLHQNKGKWEVFLILHKNGNHWGFPKGKASEGEDHKVTAIRELKEETGLSVDRFLEWEVISENYQFKRQGVTIDKHVHYYPALVSGKPVLQVQEVRAGKWLELDEAIQTLTFPGAKNVCQKIKDLCYTQTN